MTSKKVFILGGAQTDFAINWHKRQQSIYDILSDGFTRAIQKTQINIEDIQSAHIGNFVGELFCQQGQLGGLFASLHPQLAGIPTARHEAACASGSMAILAAMREIEAQCYDLVCVTGIEMMRNVDGKTASEHLGVAAWHGKEAQEAMFPWVHLFSEITEHYQEHFGLEQKHLAAIAKINYDNAKRNLNAQARNWDFDERCFLENEEHNPIVEGQLRKSDCGRITDGAAVLFLASEQYTKAYAQKRNIPFASIPYIKGWGHRTAPMLLKEKLKQDNFKQSHQTTYTFPHLHGAIQDAFKRANIENATQLDVIETHDCFSISEYVALEHFGLTLPGQAWKAIEENRINFDGPLPVNPSGGLIGLGHPVGATGVRMLLDAYKQVSNKAGDYQIEGAKNVGTLNIGGSFTTIASFVVGQ